MTVTGRWLSKPSEIRKGTVQLSARWKIKLPAITDETISNDNTRIGTSSSTALIFKGFIRAVPTLAVGGGTVSAEMKGTVLWAESKKTVGKFQADLIATDDAELRMGAGP
jgi:hypothetical protein